MNKGRSEGGHLLTAGGVARLKRCRKHRRRRTEGGLPPVDKRGRGALEGCE